MASTKVCCPSAPGRPSLHDVRLWRELLSRRWPVLTLAGIICLLFLAATAHAQSSGPGYVYDALGRLVTAYDASGNAAVYKYDAVGNLLSITNYSATQFASLELSSTSGMVGSTITIYGTDFCSSPSVTFNGLAATVVSTSLTQIVVTVPSGATTGPTLVTCGSNQANLGTFTIASNLPSISSFSPVLGVSGTSVTITGANFQPLPTNNQVIFNIAQAAVTSASGSSLTAKVPPSVTSLVQFQLYHRFRHRRDLRGSIQHADQ